MKNKKPYIYITFLFTIALSFCTQKNRILIDGSSTVYPITEGISEEYLKIEKTTQVTVGISGTGGGFKRFCTGETHISDASRLIKAKEAKKCTVNGVEFIEIAVAYDGLAVVKNKKNKFISNLTTKELNKIFAGKNFANTWNEARASFGSEKIKVFSPGQSSGTYDYFVETIVGKKGAIKSTAVFSEDDNVLVTGVAGNENAIGFFGLAYYQENKDKLDLVGIINPKTKKSVKPSLTTVKSGAYFPLSRPIFIYVNKAALKKIFVKKFVTYYLENAAKISKDVGYIPLPDSQYKVSKAKL